MPPHESAQPPERHTSDRLRQLGRLIITSLQTVAEAYGGDMSLYDPVDESARQVPQPGGSAHRRLRPTARDRRDIRWLSKTPVITAQQISDRILFADDEHPGAP